LGANDQTNEGAWIWERNNLTVNYDNWQAEKHDADMKDQLDCGCFKPSSGWWSDCDCTIAQHFTCRKPIGITGKLETIALVL